MTGAATASRDKVIEEDGVKRRFRLRRRVGADGDGDGEDAAHDVLEVEEAQHMSAVIACCL